MLNETLLLRILLLQTAIASSVDLRCYCSIRKRSDNKIALVLPDTGFAHTWDVSEITFSKSAGPDAAPIPDLLAGLTDLVPASAPAHGRLAATSFLYLVSRLAKDPKSCAFFYLSP